MDARAPLLASPRLDDAGRFVAGAFLVIFARCSRLLVSTGLSLESAIARSRLLGRLDRLADRWTGTRGELLLGAGVALAHARALRLAPLLDESMPAAVRLLKENSHERE